MALLHTNFFSSTLGMQCGMDVILPQRRNDRGWPTLWLLHGLSDDHTCWQRRTSIERYADSLEIAVIMPAVHRSFYSDMCHGLPYERFVADELPEVARALFHLASQREENFVAGLSMGGYGAFKLALKYPARYAAAASFSGALDVAARWESAQHGSDMRLIFGENPSGTDNDIFHLAKKLSSDSTQPRPRLFQSCGTEDGLLKDNHLFRDHALGLGFDLDYSEGPGNHNWAYWDAQIQLALPWLLGAG